MRRTILTSTVALLLLATTASSDAARTPLHTRAVDACLRSHGWPYGIRALERVEIRVHHPNGLIRICGSKAATTNSLLQAPAGKTDSRRGGGSSDWRAEPDDSPLKNQLSIPAATVLVPSRASGFHWAAAAIGASLGGLLTLLLARCINHRGIPSRVGSERR
jgi:hypothetical protein